MRLSHKAIRVDSIGVKVFLRRCDWLGDQVEGLQPQVQGDVGLLKDGPHGHPELPAAGIALVEPEPGCLTTIVAQWFAMRCPSRSFATYGI